MSTGWPDVQWRQDAEGFWEYLASDGRWYRADPAAGTPVPPGEPQGVAGGAMQAPATPEAPPTTPSPGLPVAPAYAPWSPAMLQCASCGQTYPGDRVACPTCGQLARARERLVLAKPSTRLGQYLLDVLLMIVTLLVGWLIWSIIIWDRGQTPGMQLTHIRVLKKDTLETATRGPMALRELVGKLLIMDVISWVTAGIATLVLDFMLLWDKDRQQLWDKIANTIVVDGDPPPKMATDATPELPSPYQA